MREALRVCRIEVNRAAFLDTGMLPKMLVNVSPLVPWGRTFLSLRNWDETQAENEESFVLRGEGTPLSRNVT